MLGRKEVVKKLITDTNSDKIKWKVTIDRQWVRAENSIEITPKKILKFKLVYYTDHPKGTKLEVTYDIKGSSINHNLYNIGGKKKSAESKELLSLMNDILLKEEKHRSVADDIKNQLNKYVPGPFDFDIGDEVIIKRDPDFRIAEGMEGIIVSEITDTDNTFYYLVDFGDPFYNMLVFPDFDFEKDDFRVNGTCWPFEPKYLKKIVKKDDNKNIGRRQKLLSSFAEFVT